MSREVKEKIGLARSIRLGLVQCGGVLWMGGRLFDIRSRYKRNPTLIIEWEGDLLAL